MRSEYSTPNGEGWAMVHEFSNDCEAEITNVRVQYSHRRQGWGNYLMRQIMADADKEDVVLLLVSGLGYDTGMSGPRLRQWYEGLGFDAVSPGSHPGTTIMQRVPRSPASLA